MKTVTVRQTELGNGAEMLIGLTFPLGSPGFGGVGGLSPVPRETVAFPS